MERIMTSFAIALLVAMGSAGATEVYRWVDADGVVHFSDTRPEDQHADTLVVRETTPPGYDPAEDPYSILNQAERLAETRARLEKDRKEREENRREAIERVVIYEREPDYRYSAYYGPWYPPAVPPAIRPVNQRRVAGDFERADPELSFVATMRVRATCVHRVAPYRLRLKRIPLGPPIGQRSALEMQVQRLTTQSNNGRGFVGLSSRRLRRKRKEPDERDAHASREARAG